MLDASALLAILNDEPGSEKLTSQLDLLSNAAISTVNLAEVHSKLVAHGMDDDEAWEAALSPVREVYGLHQPTGEDCRRAHFSDSVTRSVIGRPGLPRAGNSSPGPGLHR